MKALHAKNLSHVRVLQRIKELGLLYLQQLTPELLL
jgi:hypothetical protein